MNLIVKYGLPVFFFLLPWQTRWIFFAVPLHGEVVQYGLLSLYATQVVLLLILIFSGRRTHGSESKWPRRFVYLLVAVVAVTAISSIQPFVSLVQFMHLIFAMLLFFALLDDRVSMKRVMAGFAFGLVLPSLLGIIQFVTGGTGASTLLGLASRDAQRAGDAVIFVGEGERMLRAYGSFSHPNIFGGYLAVGVVTLFGLWNQYRVSGDRMKIVAASILFIGTLALTFSRSAWLGILLAGIVGAMVLYIKKTEFARFLVIPVALMFIGSVFALSFGLGVSARPASSAEFERRSVEERTTQYEEYVPVVAGRWLTGQGIGTYPFAYSEAFPEKSWWEYQPIHNVFLLVVAEIGIIGALFALLWSSSIDRINFKRFPNKDAVAAFMMGNVILVILFFDHYLWSSWAGLALVAYVMAMTVRLGEPVKS